MKIYPVDDTHFHMEFNGRYSGDVDVVLTNIDNKELVPCVARIGGHLFVNREYTDYYIEEMKEGHNITENSREQLQTLITSAMKGE